MVILPRSLSRSLEKCNKPQKRAQSIRAISPVLVRADKVTRLERFVSVVDRIRGLGFRQVSLEVVRA